MNRYLYRNYIRLNEVVGFDSGLSSLHDFQASAESGGLPSLDHLSDCRYFRFEPVEKNPELTFTNLDALLSLLRG